MPSKTGASSQKSLPESLWLKNTIPDGNVNLNAKIMNLFESVRYRLLFLEIVKNWKDFFKIGTKRYGTG